MTHSTVPAFGPVEPIAVDAAGPALGEEQRLAVMGDADAVGVAIALEQRPGPAGRGIVAKQPAGRAALDEVERPVMGVVARRRIR